MARTLMKPGTHARWNRCNALRTAASRCSRTSGATPRHINKYDDHEYANNHYGHEEGAPAYSFHADDSGITAHINTDIVNLPRRVNSAYL